VFFLCFSRPFRAGLTYAAPTALVDFWNSAKDREHSQEWLRHCATSRFGRLKTVSLLRPCKTAFFCHSTTLQQ